MFFTSRGRVYQLKCYEIPEASRTARGTAIVNLLQLEGKEKVTAMIPIPAEVEGHSLLMATRGGTIKKTALDEFQNLRRMGLIAIVLREDDELIGVELTDGTREVLLGTRCGRCIRFPETNIRPMGRASMGVRGIRLRADDSVVGLAVAEEAALVLAITENGYGKRTELGEYRFQSRGGSGIRAMNLTDKTGLLAAQLMVHGNEDLMLITDEGTIIRMSVGDISTQGRSTQGVRLMRVADDSHVVGVTLAEPEEEEDGSENNGDEEQGEV
jgi:DNA gyrase subunit A